MIVKVQIGNNEKMVVNVSCGEGKQSFKWLAGVIQARIKEFGILRKTFDTDAYIVTEMRNAEGDMINPKDAIFEHVQMVNGQTITAIISKSYPVDEWEYPEINDWMKVAYLESKVGKYYQNEISAWRENIEKLKSAKSFNNNLLSPRKLNSTIIKIGFDFTEDDIIAAFELDWGNMHWDWLTTNKQQINAIGDALKQQYSIICNVFAHYCGTGQVGQRYGMTLQEFMHLLHYMKVSHVDSSRSVIEEVFNRTKHSKFPENNTSKSNWPLLTRAHLVLALVCVADMERMGDSPEESINALIQVPMENFWNSVTAKYIRYTSTDENLKIISMEYYALLKQVFIGRAVIDEKFGPKMPASNMIQLLRDSTMIEAEHENLCVRSFLKAQLEPPIVWETQFMVFTEFIEALSLIAVQALDVKSNLLDTTKKIRMAFSFVTEMLGEMKLHK